MTHDPHPSQRRQPFSLSFYRALTFCSAPVLSYILRKRLKSDKEDPDRQSERRGMTHQARPAGYLIWIHAVSVGESLSALTIITRILKSYPDARILLTTGTLTSARLMSERLPRQAIHQFAPLDHPAYVTRFLDHWHPNLALMVESELWPNLILDTASRAIPMALINARMSDTSFKAWARWPRTIKSLLSSFDICLAQDQQSADRLKNLGASKVEIIGNLKFSSPALPVDETDYAQVQRQVGTRVLWLAASTHPGEEEIMAKAHQALRHHFSDLLTIIVPRHPERGVAIKNLLDDYGIRTSLRSQGETIDSATDIYIADTMGELGLFYRLAPITFVGGSLVPHGGQNPLEPARLNCATVHGPHVFNFADIYRELDERHASLLVLDAENLPEGIRRLLEDEPARLAQIEAAQQSLTQADDVIEQCFNALLPLLPHSDQAHLHTNGRNEPHARS